MKYRSCLTLLIGLHSFVLLPFAYAEPSPREWKCRYYANDAVKQNQQNVTAGCGFTGLRWSDHRDGHHSWCLSVAETQTDKENTARNKALEECFKEKSSLQNKENHPEIPASCKDSTGEYTPVRSLYPGIDTAGKSEHP